MSKIKDETVDAAYSQLQFCLVVELSYLFCSYLLNYIVLSLKSYYCYIIAIAVFKC